MLKVSVRKGVYISTGGTVATATVVCIVVDVLITWGICSAVNLGVSTAVTLTAVASTELTLASWNTNLAALKKRGEGAIAQVEAMLEEQDVMEMYLRKEEKILVRWGIMIDIVKEKVTNKERLFLRAPVVIQRMYLKSLDDLRRAAQDYLDQKDLFAVDETYLNHLLDKNGVNKRRRR